MNRLRLIGLMLDNYCDRYRSFPPASLMDSKGKPILSWRVPVNQINNYDLDFKTKMDFSKPWDDPGNLPFLDYLGDGLFQCHRSPRGRANVTHYVAVTGPGTAWSLPEPRRPDRLPGDGSRIIVVEWPPSDIHWAEPRDVTVDEFMKWFTSEDARREVFHPGCVLGLDVSGQVHEIWLDANPEEVRRMFLIEPDQGNPEPAAPAP